MNTKYLTFDEIKALLSQSAETIKNNLLAKATNTSAEAIAMAQAYALGVTERFTVVLAGFSSGELDIAFVRRRLEDEQFILEGNFLSFLELGKQALQELITDVQTQLAGILVKIILPAPITQPQ